VEIHYDVRNGRAVFRAEISGEMLDQLTNRSIGPKLRGRLTPAPGFTATPRRKG
jgi:hypothetical protein